MATHIESKYIYCPNIPLWKSVPLTVMASYDEATKSMHWIARYWNTHISGALPFESNDDMLISVNNCDINEHTLKIYIDKLTKIMENEGYVTANVLYGLREVLQNTLNGDIITPWKADHMSDYDEYDTEFPASDMDFYQRATYYIISKIIEM